LIGRVEPADDGAGAASMDPATRFDRSCGHLILKVVGGLCCMLKYGDYFRRVANRFVAGAELYFFRQLPMGVIRPYCGRFRLRSFWELSDQRTICGVFSECDIGYMVAFVSSRGRLESWSIPSGLWMALTCRGRTVAGLGFAPGTLTGCEHCLGMESRCERGDSSFHRRLESRV